MNDIEGYLRANRDAFAREALTRRLVESGHDPSAVEAAWARIEPTAGSPRQHAEPPAGRPGVGTFLVIGAVVVGYVFAAFLGLAGIIVSTSYGVPGASQRSHPAATVLSVAYGIAMVGGLGYSIVRIYRSPSIREGGSAIGAALTIAFIVLVGISGVCVAGVVASNAFGGL